MNLEGIQIKIREIPSLNCMDILDAYSINLIYDSQMNKYKMDSMLRTLHHHTIIFMKTNLEENYEKFLLFHEIGHYILHYVEDMKYSFYLSRYKNRLEREANAFACLCLLSDEEYEEVNIIELLKNKGVPQQIAIQFYETISQFYKQ